MHQITDVDLKAGRITINRVKGSMSGTYPMSPDTVKLLRSYLNSRKDVSPYIIPQRRNGPEMFEDVPSLTQSLVIIEYDEKSYSPAGCRERSAT